MKIHLQLLTAFVLASGSASWVLADTIPANCKPTGGHDPYSGEPTYHCTQKDGTLRLCGAADIKDKRDGCTAALISTDTSPTLTPVNRLDKFQAVQPLSAVAPTSPSGSGAGALPITTSNKSRMALPSAVPASSSGHESDASPPKGQKANRAPAE